MRVFFVVDNDLLFHPNLLDRLLGSRSHEWAGIAMCPDDGASRHMRKQLPFVGLGGAIRLGWQNAKRMAYAKIASPVTGVPVTVSDVARKHGVPCIETDDINHPAFLVTVRAMRPDVIVSSTGRIFGPELLRVPKLGCINRHSSLLPRHRGILPVLHAIAEGDSHTGVSIHFMEEKIDAGPVIVSDRVRLRPRESLLDAYARCFELSERLLHDALDLLSNGRTRGPQYAGSPASYHSYPTAEDWRRFRRNGGRLA